MTARPAAPEVGSRRAWAWLAHLREGGTTPWAEWTAEAEVRGPALPGAQQLELVRRVNQAGGAPSATVDRILATSAPGRGQPDLELVGAALDSSFGPRPVDPTDLAPGELLRVASAVIAEDLLAVGPGPETRAGIPRPWRRPYHLVGDPELAAPLRATLVERGRPPGGRAARVLVVGTSLDRMLADAWTHRAFDTGAPAWHHWLRRISRRDELPGRIDLLRKARTWSERVGRGRVHVVLDPALVPGLLGVRRPLPPVPALAATVPDLARRVAFVLGLHVPAEQRSALLRRTLRPALSGVTGPGLVLPAGQRSWAGARARQLTDGLLRAGYAVHGDPGVLQTVERVGAEAPVDGATLALAVRVLRDDVLRSGSTTKEGT